MENEKITFNSRREATGAPNEQLLDQMKKVLEAAKLGEPKPLEMAANLANAATRWAGAGFPVVDQAVYDVRSAACEACELWDAKARLGMGKCKAPGCGCTSLKRWLETERCPHPAGSRWLLDKARNK